MYLYHMNPLRIAHRLFDLWPFLWRTALLMAMIFIFLPLQGFSLMTFLAFGAICFLIYRGRWIFPFAKKVWYFQRVAAPGIHLLYDAELQDLNNQSSVLETCQMELARLTEGFGFPLHGRLRVFVFSHWKEINEIFEKQTGALALVNVNAILIGNDHPYITEVIRHELTHLFTGRWDWFAPPLLKEGLATWLQGSYWNQPIDLAALPYLKDRKSGLGSLLSRKLFYSDPHRDSCYLLAASFTGFLISRYGWERYKKLYRRATVIDFKAQFKKCTGASFEIAESQWRGEKLGEIQGG